MLYPSLDSLSVLNVGEFELEVSCQGVQEGVAPKLWGAIFPAHFKVTNRPRQQGLNLQLGEPLADAHPGTESKGQERKRLLGLDLSIRLGLEEPLGNKLLTLAKVLVVVGHDVLGHDDVVIGWHLVPTQDDIISQSPQIAHYDWFQTLGLLDAGPQVGHVLHFVSGQGSVLGGQFLHDFLSENLLLVWILREQVQDRGHGIGGLKGDQNV